MVAGGIGGRVRSAGREMRGRGNEKLKEPLDRKWMFAITREIVYKWLRGRENESDVVR